MTTFSPGFARFVLVLIVTLFVTLTGRVAYLQTWGREKIVKQAERQTHQKESLHARRGSIFDCNGMLMAGTVQLRSVFVDPKFMHQEFEKRPGGLGEMDLAVAKLANYLELKPFELSEKLGEKPDSRYLVIAERIDDSVAKQIARLDIPGVGFEPVDARYYPMGSLAAHLIGGVRSDNVGLEGLELKFDTELAGRDGFKRSLKDAKRNSIMVAADDYVPPDHGQHVILTIDSNIQMIAEQELARTCQQFKATRGEAIVMDPRTGDIVALANYPTFNPQNLEDTEKNPEIRRNRAITDPYEPGSTLKPFLVGPAIAQKITQPTEPFDLNNGVWRTAYGRAIKDVHGYPQLILWDVLVKSSNIGMCKLAERMGATKMFDALSNFGFGKLTNIDLEGENDGRVNPLAKWGKMSIDSVAQGYEIMVTPLQLARAFAAYANGGKLITPRIVKGTLRPDGSIQSMTKPRSLDSMPEVIDPQTSAEMRQIMSDVVVRGTAKNARSKVYNVFGKTGTAHIAQRGGGYDEKHYTSSFIGGAPLENPKLVITFIVHEADRSIAHFGGYVAAPGAVRTLERSLSYMQIPESPAIPPPPPQIASGLWNFDPALYGEKWKERLEKTADVKE